MSQDAEKDSMERIEDEAINDFVENSEGFSGRDIKNILKLANLQAMATGNRITTKDIEYISQFNPTVVKKQETSN